MSMSVPDGEGEGGPDDVPGTARLSIATTAMFEKAFPYLNVFSARGKALRAGGGAGRVRFRVSCVVCVVCRVS